MNFTDFHWLSLNVSWILILFSLCSATTWVQSLSISHLRWLQWIGLFLLLPNLFLVHSVCHIRGSPLSHIFHVSKRNGLKTEQKWSRYLHTFFWNERLVIHVNIIPPEISYSCGKKSHSVIPLHTLLKVTDACIQLHSSGFPVCLLRPIEEDSANSVFTSPMERASDLKK